MIYFAGGSFNTEHLKKRYVYFHFVWSPQIELCISLYASVIHIFIKPQGSHKTFISFRPLPSHQQQTNVWQLLMARILATQERPLSPSPTDIGHGASPASDPLLAASKEDVRKMLDILNLEDGKAEMQKTRTDVLRTAFADILW